VVKLDELPSNWGWMSATKKTLRVKRPATLTNPEPPSFAMFAGLLRAAASQHGIEAKLTAAMNEGYRKARADGIDSETKVREQLNRVHDRTYKTLQADVEAFEAASGIRIRGYGGGRLGEVVAQLRRLDAAKAGESLERIAMQLKDTAECADVARKLLLEFQANGQTFKQAEQ